MNDWSPPHTPTRERPTSEEVRVDPRLVYYFFFSTRARVVRVDARSGTPERARDLTHIRDDARANIVFPAKRGLGRMTRRVDDDATLHVGGFARD
jgi:hypothetical protein